MTMRELISNFPNQLREAMSIGTSTPLREADKTFDNVLITGLGGSGIAGTIIAELTAQHVKIPVTVNNDYFIPAFVGPRTLVIASSYSGNTEETLEAFEHARKQGAHIVCITSGGKIAQLADEYGFDKIVIPGGMPPRSCFGYSLTQQFIIFSHFGLINQAMVDALKGVPDFLDANLTEIMKKAEELTNLLYGRMPVIYAGAGTGGVAIRFRQQVNENAKMLCWHHVLPEMNHNELVGWAGGDDEKAVVVFRNETD